MLSRNLSILSICDDEDIQFTRELVLRSEGHEVVSLSSDHIPPARQLNDFDIAILCRTVSRRRAFEIATLLRESNPRIRLLRIDSAELVSDGELRLQRGLINSPGALLGAIRSLCDSQLQTKM